MIVDIAARARAVEERAHKLYGFSCLVFSFFLLLFFSSFSLGRKGVFFWAPAKLRTTEIACFQQHHDEEDAYRPIRKSPKLDLGLERAQITHESTTQGSLRFGVFPDLREIP